MKVQVDVFQASKMFKSSSSSVFAEIRISGDAEILKSPLASIEPCFCGWSRFVGGPGRPGGYQGSVRMKGL